MKRKTTILLADDHALLRMGLASLIGYQPDMEVVGEAEDGQKAVLLARRVKPDVVIMDLMMPVMNGVEATRQILADSPGTKVVILTSFPESVDLVRAVSSGAVAAAIKDTPNERLLTIMRKVIAGQQVFPPEIRRQLEELRTFANLSDRQLELLQLAARGFNTDDIATNLGISIDGVKKHFSSLFQKLGVANRSEAVAIALRKHLLKI